MKHSVCMAVYNGSQYIREQAASILPQLGGGDEIVAVDDASQDASVAILEGFHDPRIRIIRHAENRGVLRTFERALREASGEIIFLSDQDDIWHPDKIARIVKTFVDNRRMTLVLSNGELIDSSGRPLSRQLYGNDSFTPGVFSNLIKNRYQGSTMAFRRGILEAVLPFPEGIPMHDSWIGLVNAVIGRTAYLPESLLFYRRHVGNVTAPRHGPLLRMAGQRWRLASSLALRMGTMMRVKRRLCKQGRGTAAVCVTAERGTSSNETDCQRRAVVFAPFFSGDAPVSRPRSVGSVLAGMMPVDVVTSDLDHTRKSKRDQFSCSPFERVVYLPSRPYGSNVGAARLLSHFDLAFKAAAYFRKNRDQYDVVYSTVPLNVMTWLVFILARGKMRIIDVVDIWPDVLPFSPIVRRVCAPGFALWKWFFKSAVAKAGIVMAVSDSFISEAARYANDGAIIKRFYIGHERLVSAVPKQPIFTVAYVGNLGRLYDFETLVDVLAEAELRDTVQFFLIGKGDRQEWLVGELERRNLRYRFFGTVFDTARLADILRSCHVGFNGYINTSAAFSYKAGTYFAAGLPIINSMTGDLQQLVEEYRLGENYEGGNRNQLKECLMRLSRNDTTDLAANCETLFDSLLDASKIGADMRGFLDAHL
jgi:glycosyltransferase involved in cell wall biosynthesis